MTPLVIKMTPKEAAAFLSPEDGPVMDQRTFKKWATKLGFTKYPGTTDKKVFYSKDDLIKKWNQPEEDVKPKKSRGKIKI